MSRVLVLLIVVAVVAFGIFAWSRTLQRAEAPAPAPGAETGADPGAEIEVRSAGDPGLTWKDPPGWAAQGGSSMRLATYQVPGAGGQPPASCAVYYFGPGQGGGTEENLARWAGEFADASEPERSTTRRDGLTVTRVRVRGHYQAHGAMGGGASGPIENAELLGAIVEGPNGNVFFKLAGPAATVSKAVPAFDAMLASLRPKGAASAP